MVNRMVSFFRDHRNEADMLQTCNASLPYGTTLMIPRPPIGACLDAPTRLLGTGAAPKLGFRLNIRRNQTRSRSRIVDVLNPHIGCAGIS